MQKSNIFDVPKLAIKHIKLFMLYLIFRKRLIAFRFSALLHYKKKSQRVPTKFFIVQHYLPPSSGCLYFHCRFARIELVANIQDLQKCNFKSLALRKYFQYFYRFPIVSVLLLVHLLHKMHFRTDN